MKFNYDMLKFVVIMVVILSIILLVCKIRYIQESFANMKCLENGYKLAFPEKINSGGILNNKNKFMSYDGINDGRLTPMTLDNDTLTLLNYILGNILNSVNGKTGAKYMLRKIDSVNINKIKQGSIIGATVDRETNKRITVDFFAHELTKSETRRFIVIFTIDAKRNIKVEHINLSNAFKYDFNDNNTSNVVNDNLILTDAALIPNTKVVGINNSTTLDYTNLTESEKNTNKNIGFTNPGEVGKVLFLPNAIHETGLLNSQGLFPNRKHNGWWDENGVSLVEKPSCKKNIKTGLDHAIGTRPFVPYDNPTVARYEGESYKNKHHDIFNLARGNFLGPNVAI